MMPATAAAGRCAGTPSALAGRRIVFINRYYFPDCSATAQLLADLVASLSDLPVDVRIVASRQRYDDASARLPRREALGNATIHRVGGSRFGRGRLPGRLLDYLSFYAGASVWALRLLRPGDILIALTDPPLMSVPAAGIAGLRGARSINWLQDVFPEVAVELGVLRRPRWVLAALRALRDWSLRRASCNVAIGQRMGALVAGRGIEAERIRIIENWAVGGLSEPRPAGASRLRARVAAQARFIVQYSGNLGRAHDYRTILEAARLLSGEPGWLFLMVGGGVNMALLRAAAEREPLNNMRFLPYQPLAELADSLAAGDVHLSCLRPALEGMIVPSKSYGILAAGRPMIFIGDVESELAALLHAADCGRVVAPGDPAGLAALLRWMRSETAWREAAGRRAWRLCKLRHSPGTAHGSWRRLLLEVAA